MAFSDVQCRNVRANGKLQKLSDGGGLQLWVTPKGSRWWRLAYRFHGKQKTFGVRRLLNDVLGRRSTSPEEAKALLADGIDPSRQRKEKKEEDRNDRFRVIGEEYVQKLEKEGCAKKTIAKTKWLLEFAYKEFGDESIKRIDAPLVLKALRKLEARGRYESARRLRSSIGRVFRYAIATARAQFDPTIALQNALIAPKVKSRAAITEPDALGALPRAIDLFDGQPETRAALRLMPLLFPRPGELRLVR